MNFLLWINFITVTVSSFFLSLPPTLFSLSSSLTLIMIKLNEKLNWIKRKNVPRVRERESNRERGGKVFGVLVFPAPRLPLSPPRTMWKLVEGSEIFQNLLEESRLSEKERLFDLVQWDSEVLTVTLSFLSTVWMANVSDRFVSIKCKNGCHRILSEYFRIF